MDMSADEVLQAMGQEPQDRTARTEAVTWLRELLADGALPAREVFKLGSDNGLSKRTLERAKADARVHSRKDGIGKDSKWVWGVTDA